ncbi:MAG: hypothetical protein ACYC8T_15790 [Myxococcaceae bacterium]
MNSRTLFALVASTALLAGCATITPVPYAAQPGRVADPANEAATLIKANVVGGCIAEPSYEKPLLIVKFVCSNGLGNTVAKLDRVEKIYLEQSGEWYRVVVRHIGAGEDFTWSSKSLDDMQRLADALTALSQPAADGEKKQPSSI